MSDQTYKPTGTGLCATCGRSVWAHVDSAHKYVPCNCFVCWDEEERYGGERRCVAKGCDKYEDDPIHDVGRVLRCPTRDDSTDPGATGVAAGGR